MFVNINTNWYILLSKLVIKKRQSSAGLLFEAFSGERD